MSFFFRIAWLSLLFVGTSAFAVTHTVTVGGSANAFTPRTMTINVGDSIAFVNAGGFHNVVADDNSFTSGAATSDAFTFTQTFNTPGTFGYYCSIHGAPNGTGMSGSITVNAVTAPTFPISGVLSGSWFDAAQSGHGFSIQVAPSNVFIFYWFVYTPDGTQQAWILGSGSYDPASNSVTVEGAQQNGAKFPPNFNATDLTTTDWGSVTFAFTDCNNGTVSWVSKLPPYGSGTLPITKIIGVNGLTCPN